MFISCEVDPEKGMTRARYSGTLTAADMREFRQRLTAHPGFSPELDHFADLTEVEHVDMAAEELASLAATTPFGPEARVALVAPRDVVYGLARAFEIQAESRSAGFRVFRDPAAAWAWLGQSAG